MENRIIIQRRMISTVLVWSTLVVHVLGQTWDGGGSSNNWTDANNWNPNAIPASNGTANLIFGGTTRLTPVMNASFNVNSVNFNNASGAFTINNSGSAALTIQLGGITNNGEPLRTLNVPIILASSHTWDGNGTLAVGGTVSLGANTLTANNTGIIALSGIVSGAGSIIKSGGGSLQLNAANSFTGGVTLNDGAIQLGHNNGLGTGVLTVNGGTVLAGVAPRTVANAVTLEADLAIGGSNALTFSGPITLTGDRTLTNGAATTFSGALSGDAPGRELTKAGAATLTLSDAALTPSISLKLNSGTLAANGLTIAFGNSFTQSGGTYTGAMTNRGLFVYNGGIHSGQLANETGGEAVFNANFTVNAALNNAGKIRVTSGRTLTFGSNTLNNTGTVTLEGGTLSAAGATTFASSGILTGFGTISANNTNFSNSGQVHVSGGNLAITSNLSPANSGSINVAEGTELQLTAAATTLLNSGLVALAGGAVTGSGLMTNNAGGEIRGVGRVGVPLTNAGGLVRAAGSGVLTIDSLVGGNLVGGELRVDDGAIMNVQSSFASSGTIVLGGSNASLNLTTTTNNGILRGQGRVSGAVLNHSVVRAEGGTLTFASLSNTNAANGRIESGPGAQVLYTQGLATNSGLIALTGGAFDNNGVALPNPGRIEGYGTLRTGGLNNTGTISVGGPLDVLGPMTNNNVVSTSAGSTIRLFGPASGTGSYTGTGTVVFLNAFNPGASPAVISFSGNMELASAASLHMEIGGTMPGTQYDRLNVAGTATLDGTLQVSLLNNFTPAAGQSFEIVSAAGGINGEFSTLELPPLTGSLQWNLLYGANSLTLAVLPGLAGDYNGNGIVDAADYTLWRDKLGTAGPLPGDTTPGSVTQADYDVWRQEFGKTITGGAGSAGTIVAGGTAVPEPAGAVLWAGGLVLLFAARSWPQNARR